MKRQLIPKGTVLKYKTKTNYFHKSDNEHSLVEIIDYQCGFYIAKLLNRVYNTHHEVRTLQTTFIEASILYQDYEISLKSLKNL